MNTCQDKWLLSLICLAFLAIRIPIMYLQPGGQDEDCYAVPGFTILNSGIPKLPHVPARNSKSVYYHADEALYSEPPLYFYYQAPFYLIFPAVYGTARLASAFAGVVLLGLVYRLCREIGVSSIASLWTVAIFSISRWFYFPATTARPDILCATFGIAVILILLKWQQTKNVKSLILAGLGIGLGGLTHPFAIVYAIQAAAWVAICSRGWQRLSNPLILGAVAGLVCSLWIPLIAMHPEVFRVQFTNQFLSDYGSPLWERAIFPLESMEYHARHLWAHIGTPQAIVVLVGLAMTSLHAIRSAKTHLLAVCLCAWSSIYILSVAVGTHHPTLGYWVYFAALTFPSVGVAIEQLFNLLDRVTSQRIAPNLATPDHSHELTSVTKNEETPHPSARPEMGGSNSWPFYFAVVSVCAFVFLPGSGLRTLAVHLTHLDDPNYNSPRFARDLIQSMPAQSVYAVDTQFAFDFVASGRTTLLAQIMPQYFQLQDAHYDYLILSRYGDQSELESHLNVKFIEAYGLKEDKWACYAELYSKKSPVTQP